MHYRPNILALILACALVLAGAIATGCANPQLPTDVTGPPDLEPPGVPVPEPDPEPPILAHTTILIDFDSVAPGIVGEAFAATGFGAAPAAGQLDADAWSVLGFSDGDLDFGEETATGDWARGISPGGVSTGGLYAFTVELDNRALGIQPTASDFAPGSIILRTAVPADTVTEVQLAYRMMTLNDQDRATVWNAWYSLDGTTWSELTGTEHATPTLADSSPEWSGTDYTTVVSLEDAPLGVGDPFYLRWDAVDGEGDGNRDESAIDDISLVFSYAE